MAGRRRAGGAGDRGVEWLCAGVMVWWATALALPGDIMSTPSFAGFARHGLAQEQWVWLFAGMGGGRVAALFINGRWPRTPHIRIVCSLFGCVIFGQLSWLFLQGSFITHGPFQTGTGVYALLALAELSSIFRAAHDARYYHG